MSAIKECQILRACLKLRITWLSPAGLKGSRKAGSIHSWVLPDGKNKEIRGFRLLTTQFSKMMNHSVDKQKSKESRGLNDYK